ncbi:hypothetical protein [Thiomonas sp. X19]|nr:hypothetical protein [Thiomonas sp. X19]
MQGNSITGVPSIIGFVILQNGLDAFFGILTRQVRVALSQAVDQFGAEAS